MRHFVTISRTTGNICCENCDWVVPEEQLRYDIGGARRAIEHHVNTAGQPQPTHFEYHRPTLRELLEGRR